MADTNQQAMEAALRQAYRAGLIEIPEVHTSDVAAFLCDTLEALGVDPAGTTEPQGDVNGLQSRWCGGPALPQTMHDSREAWCPECAPTPAEYAALLDRADAAEAARALQAEVERLTARVAALEAAGDAMASCHAGYMADWRKAVRGDDLDPQPEETT